MKLSPPKEITCCVSEFAGLFIFLSTVAVNFNKFVDKRECMLTTVLMVLVICLGWEDGILRDESRAQCGHRCGH